jgi:quercetin dioxygenase-like cupin family protein
MATRLPYAPLTALIGVKGSTETWQANAVIAREIARGLTHIKACVGRRRYTLRMSQKTLIASTEAQAILLADAAQVSPSGIVSRTLLQSPEARVVLFTFADGQELTAHTSVRRALVQILDGACDFFFAGQWQRLAAGTFLHLPPNHPHAVRAAAGPFSMLLTLGAEGAATPAHSPS